MAQGEQELKLKARVDGAKEAAREIGDVGKATEQVGKEADKAKTPIKDQTEAQKTLNAAEGDYLGILSAIHPVLGAFAGSVLNAVKVSGDLANKQIDLKGILESATTAVKDNAGALASIGSGGAVVIGIMAIVAALAKTKEEAQRVKAALREMLQALNEVEGKKIETQADLERRSAARPEGPYDAPESAQAMQAYEGLGAQAPYLSEEARKQAVLAGGAEASVGRLERIAALFESGKAWQGYGPDDLIGRMQSQREDMLNTQLSHFAKQIDTTIKREREQAGTTEVARAKEEAGAAVGGASTAHLAEFIKKLPGRGFEDMDADLLAVAVQALAGAPEGVERRRASQRQVWNAGGPGGETIRSLEGVGQYLDEQNVPKRATEPDYVRAAQMILQQLKKASAKRTEAAEKLDKAAGAAGGTPEWVKWDDEELARRVENMRDMLEGFIKAGEAAERLDGKIEVGATHHHYHNDKYVTAPGAASTVGKGRRDFVGD